MSAKGRASATPTAPTAMPRTGPRVNSPSGRSAAAAVAAVRARPNASVAAGVEQLLVAHDPGGGGICLFKPVSGAERLRVIRAVADELDD